MATTINTYSVGLTLNAADYINKAALSATESRRMARAIEAARDPAEKFTLAQDRLTKALEKGGISHEVYNRLLDAERAKLDAATASTQQAKDAAKAMESTISAVNGVLAKTETTVERNTRLAAEFRKALAAGKITSGEYARGLEHLRKSSEQSSDAHKRMTAQIGQAQSIVRSIASPQQVYRDQTASLNAALKAGAISQEQHAKATEHVRRAAIGATAAGQRFNESFRSARSIIASAETASERYERQLIDLQRALKHGKISQDEFSRGAAHLKAQVTATASPMTGMVRHLRALAAAYVGIHTVTKSINLAVQAEQAAASFEILTGSVEGSRAMIRELADFAARSPITLSGTQDAAKTMMAFNIPAREVMRNIQMLGDISMGNQQRFDSLTLAFSQMSAAGRLMGQDLLQMINAGFNPLQEISRKTGESITDLKTRMEQGGISAQEVTEAFESATAEGGKFAGMTDRLADTMGGKMAVAMSNLEQSGAKLGEAIGPLVIALTDGFNEGASSIQWAITLVEKFADGMGFALAVATDMGNALANWDFDAQWDKSNAFLDSLEKRQREREAAMREASSDALGGSDGPMAGMVDAVDDMADAFEKQLQAIELQIVALNEGEAAARRIRLAADGLSDEQIRQIEAQHNILRLLKEENDRRKKNTEEAKKLADELDRDLGRALGAAQEYFARERQRDAKMREQISQGPGAGMEVGSAAAVKFLADQQNAAIGAAAVPERPTPGEEAIAKEAQKQLQEMQATRKAAEAQRETLRQMLDELKENGFAGVG